MAYSRLEMAGINAQILSIVNSSRGLAWSASSLCRVLWPGNPATEEIMIEGKTEPTTRIAYVYDRLITMLNRGQVGRAIPREETDQFGPAPYTPSGDGHGHKGRPCALCSLVLALLMVLAMACGQPTGAPIMPLSPPPALSMPAPEPPVSRPGPAPAPSRLRLPSMSVEIQGVRVPVGPMTDLDTGLRCNLVPLSDGSGAVCQPVSAVRLDPATDTACVDDLCMSCAARLSGASEGWDGIRTIWRLGEDRGVIPPGQAAYSVRTPDGSCRRERVIMAGSGWTWATPGPLLFWAILRKVLE